MPAAEPVPVTVMPEPATPTLLPTTVAATISSSPSVEAVVPTQTTAPFLTSTAAALPSPTAVPPSPTAVPPTSTPTFEQQITIGHSFDNIPIVAHRFKEGEREIVVVGGIHGGYEWNTILLARAMVDHFRQSPDDIPDSITLTIIPVANPDGLQRVAGTSDEFSQEDLTADTSVGRFNGNFVDLNRNWDCEWQETGIWRGREVSGGYMVFSEPETVALRDYFLQQQPAAVIFLHSALNGVFASGCPQTYRPSLELAQIYGNAANYPIYERFTAYEITGDAGDWLATQGITSISVELRNHEDPDRAKNFAGMMAILDYYR